MIGKGFNHIEKERIEPYKAYKHFVFCGQYYGFA